MDLVLPRPGTYVVAVSGGVDSVALLHALQSTPGLKLIVAHFDHGIREDSGADRLLVQQLARQYDRPFVYDAKQLGPRTSEDDARRARYTFLHRVRRAGDARAILTAHHQDDVLETAIINLLRGTGRKGLTALNQQSAIQRPFLNLTKQELVAYAQANGLRWREDSTNADESYLRNYVRHRLLPKFDQASRQQLLSIVTNLSKVNYELDTALINQLHTQSISGQLDRVWFNHLPHIVAREVLATWLRAHGLRQFDKKTLERLVVAAKTASAGCQFDVLQGAKMLVRTDHLALVRAER